MDEQKQLRALLNEFKDVFSLDSSEIGCIPGVKHRIITGDHPPIRQRPCRTEFAKRAEVRRQIHQMLDQGIIRRSSSPWASPVFLVEKKDSTQRFCIDFRKINYITKQDSFPLPLISEILDSLDQAKYFTSFDVTSGYHHVMVDERDIEKTAFVTFDGC